MATVVSKIGVHCIGAKRDGYGAFLTNLNAAGRKLSLVKVRDDFGAVDEPLTLWPDLITIGAMTSWDDADYNVDTAYARITDAHRLNPRIKYWEYFNERDGDYAAQADFYIALMPRLAAARIGLCMFNSASGTPAYPADDPVPYREIARACAFMNAHGYNVLLGLHEYFTESDTIGRYHKVADYLSANHALLPIAITEYGYEVYGLNDAAYMNMIRQNDPIYMQDRYLIGCALWTLGGGGWAQSNYQTMLPALGEYMITVEPISTEPPPPPPPPSPPPPVGTRGDPRIQYPRTYNVIPANVTDARAAEIFLAGWQRSRETAGGSYDDGGLGNLDSRTVNLWDIPQADQQTYRDWYVTNYPGVIVNFPASATPAANAKPGCLPVPKAILRRLIK